MNPQEVARVFVDFDPEVIGAIRKRHLKANISFYEAHPEWYTLRWDQAWVDPGGTIWGPGPYVKLPIAIHEPDSKPGECVIRVYAPERLRRRLALLACPPSGQPSVGGPG